MVDFSYIQSDWHTSHDKRPQKALRNREIAYEETMSNLLFLIDFLQQTG